MFTVALTVRIKLSGQVWTLHWSNQKVQTEDEMHNLADSKGPFFNTHAFNTQNSIRAALSRLNTRGHKADSLYYLDLSNNIYRMTFRWGLLSRKGKEIFMAAFHRHMCRSQTFLLIQQIWSLCQHVSHLACHRRLSCAKVCEDD